MKFSARNLAVIAVACIVATATQALGEDKVYIKGGADEGNKFMGQFDDAASAMTGRLDPFVERSSRGQDWAQIREDAWRAAAEEREQPTKPTRRRRSA